MQTVYLTCVILGVAVPVLSFVLGLIGDVFSAIGDLAAHFDVHADLDPGGLAFSVFPTSLMSISAGVLLFGGTGFLLGYTPLHALPLAIFAIALAAGYAMSLVIQNAVINRLRSVESPSHKDEDIFGLDGRVVDAIVENGFGVVTFSTTVGKVIYPACSEDGKRIGQGEDVVPIKFDKKILIVRRSPSNQQQ
ncbi:hypothetical protein CLOSTMETH_02698 [[Clostridium] methylpentosum DSM 5476]|uniref:Membrane protein NfeD2 N-terminal transmembrane domain-containing protein n=1 Tax=[Clostridium] methylpentosum DSM 5476 TaxID=537013 RepID=C0EFQ6_9FIRM|nr:hypothetical protein CLOSTMETH_02698 [[Clostridium] methylpentosum DSM 5476]MDY3989860.1 hypothetical protein [Massilioclostridium sp.]MEE1492859.1 hypothetical protein [Massilioclostridium sp.]